MGCIFKKKPGITYCFCMINGQSMRWRRTLCIQYTLSLLGKRAFSALPWPFPQQLPCGWGSIGPCKA